MFKFKKKPKKIKYGSKNILKAIETWKYLIIQEEKKKNEYPYFGLKCYYGGQGKGKTLSAVREVIYKLKRYPRTILITNVDIKDIKNKTYKFSTPEELMELLDKIVNTESTDGVIVLADEIQVLFSEMFREGYNENLLMWLAQMRKSHLEIIGTTQQFSKLPRLIRDYILQNGQLVYCNKLKFTRIIQINKYLDMDTTTTDSNNNLRPQAMYYEWFFHTKELYECYDTRAIISTITSSLKKKRNINYENIYD